MIKFEYTFISINFSSVTRPSGFHIALGEEWEDMEFNTVNTNGEYVKSIDSSIDLLSGEDLEQILDEYATTTNTAHTKVELDYDTEWGGYYNYDLLS